MLAGAVVVVLAIGGGLIFARHGLNRTETFGADWDAGYTVTANEAAQLQGALGTEPGNIAARSKLLVYAARNGDAQTYRTHYGWFVRNKPMVPGLVTNDTLLGSKVSREEQTELAAQWRRNVARYSDIEAVLVNAAMYFAKADPKRALDLYGQAETVARRSSKYDREQRGLQRRIEQELPLIQLRDSLTKTN